MSDLPKTIKIHELPEISEVNDSDIFIIEDGLVTHKITGAKLIECIKNNVNINEYFVHQESVNSANGIAPLNENLKIPTVNLPFGTTTGTVFDGSRGKALEDGLDAHLLDTNDPHGANAYTNTKIAELINGAPTTLDTLKEIADAMEENEDVVEALDTAIGTKASQMDLDSHINDTAIHHSHENKDILDIITQEKIDAWDSGISGESSIGNADTLDGHDSEYFAQAAQLEAYAPTKYIGNTEDEINAIYDSLHESVENGSAYRAVVQHEVAHSVLGDGTWYLEGFRSEAKYGHQIIKIYNSSDVVIKVYMRSLYNRTWGKWMQFASMECLMNYFPSINKHITVATGSDIKAIAEDTNICPLGSTTYLRMYQPINAPFDNGDFYVTVKKIPDITTWIRVTAEAVGGSTTHNMVMTNGVWGEWDSDMTEKRTNTFKNPVTFAGNVSGNEGGEVYFAKPTENTRFAGNITVDIYGNTLRAYARVDEETSARVAMLDFTKLGHGSEFIHTGNLSEYLGTQVTYTLDGTTLHINTK